jgi:hypothetical protein
MIVNVDDINFTYTSDYNILKPSDNGWKKQNQDSFKFIMLGGKRVFVKRFDKEPKYISGFDFLQKVKNKKYPYLPKIYDLIKVSESNNDIYYLFQEALSGDTLEENVKKSVFFLNPKKFASQIYTAFSTISDHGFWFTDFIEKNIFIANDGNYYLIDLDSVAPLSVKPNEDHHFISSTNKNYIIAVSKYFYKDFLSYDFKIISQNLRGNTVNYLQLFIYISQLSFFIKNISDIDFFDVSTRRNTVKYLCDINETKTIALFKSCFSPDGSHQSILNKNLLLNFISNDIFTENVTFKIDFRNKMVMNDTGKIIHGRDINLEELKRKRKKAQEDQRAQEESRRKSYLLRQQLLRDTNIKKELNNLKSQNIIPYKCNNCSFPLKKQKRSNFNSFLIFLAIIIPFIVLQQLNENIVILFPLLIISIITYFFLISILPKKIIFEQLECSDCKTKYFVSKEKYNN